MSHTDLLTPITPGEILHEEFMKPHGLSANRLSRDIDVPANRITAIIAGERAISADTALRLAAYFGIEPEFWINLQGHYDLRLAEHQAGDVIRSRVRPLHAA